jgi:hypothetical protein
MHARTMMLAVASAALALVPTRSTDLAEQRLPVEGGSGGTAFTRECGAGKVLTGFQIMTEPTLVAIGLLCRPVNADGTLGPMTSVGERAGGTRGDGGQVYCSAGQVVGGAVIHFTTVVVGLQMRCYAWKPTTRRMGDSYAMAVAIGRRDIGKAAGASCAASTQPVVAMRGRADRFVDALGFTCNEP